MHFLLVAFVLSFCATVVRPTLCAASLRATEQAGGASARQAPEGVAVGSHVIDGPAPPDTPGAMARDASGKSTIRAIKLTEPLRLDGALDEAVYQASPALAACCRSRPVTESPRPRRPRSG